MKKLLLILCLLFSTNAFATDWYACSGSGNMSTRDWYSNPGSEIADCTCVSPTGQLIWNNQALGDSFYANGCSISIDVDPQGTGQSAGTVTIRTDTGIGRTGGTFTVATSTSPITVHANREAGTSVCLAVSGSANANPALTLLGYSKGGSGINTHGTQSSHTVGTLALGTAVNTGGSGAGARGFYLSSAGPVTFSGSCIGKLAAGCENAGGGNYTWAADCIGSDTSVDTVGCRNASTGSITITSNLLNNTKGAAISGNVYWNPASASNYYRVQGPTSGSWEYLSMPPAITDVKNGVTYGSDGTNPLVGNYTASGGGGTWGN